MTADGNAEAERVEDTRTLQPGDRVRVVIEGKLMETSASPLDASSLLDSNGDWVWLNLTRPGFVVYRLPKPLPPEPPVGVEVLGVTRSGTPLVFERWEDRGWATSIDGPMPWAVLLARYGPVRPLGHPIEAPR